MNKIASACICTIVLLMLAGGANAISVENVTKLDITETDLWNTVLSPDGTRLAFIAYDEKRTQQIFLMNTDGTGKKKLTDNADKKWGLAWGKDELAYVSYGTDGLEKIFVINPDGTGNRQLILDNSRQGNFEKYMLEWGAPSWSPDGSLLAYTSLDEKENPKIYIVNADGTGKKQVLNDTFKQWSPSFGYDSKSLVYVSYPETKFKEELFTVEISGNTRKQITFDEIKKNYPAWGPEGTIVFVSYESLTSSGEQLFAINQDGANLRLFTGGDYKQRYPSFSIDGRKFAYAAVDVSGNVKIAVGDVAGITGTATTMITGKTPASPPLMTKTPAIKEEAPEENKNVLWTVLMVLGVAVILLLVMMALKDHFKK